MLKCEYPTCQLCQDWCDERKGKFTRDPDGLGLGKRTTKTHKTKPPRKFDKLVKAIYAIGEMNKEK